MTEIRFSYNPFTKDYIYSSTSHSVAIYNQGKQKQFDEYIRGIIVEKKLYLRLYYPFNNLDELDLVELKQRSRELLENYKDEVLNVVRCYPINEIIYNVENDLLSGIGLANI